MSNAKTLHLQFADGEIEVGTLIDALYEQERTIAILRQHKNDYMEAAEGTRKALEAENARLERLVSHWQGLAVTNRKVADDALAQLAAIQQAKGEEVEVVGWLGGNGLHAEERMASGAPFPLMTVAQHQRITAAMAAEVERLRKFEAAYNEWQEKTDWVQETIKTHELGKHRADVLKDRLARWLERVNQPYDYADVEAAQQKDGN